VPSPTDSVVRQAVISCYRASGSTSPTIQQMHDCAGVWITPRSLLQCALEAKCQAFGDSLADRGEFFGTLQALKLDVTSPLILPSNGDDLPLMPSAEKITECKRTSSSPAAFSSCVVPTMLPKKYDPLVACFAKKTDKERVDCFSQQVNNPTFTSLLQCLGDGRPTPDKLMKCGAVPAIQAAADDVRKCISLANTPDTKRACLLKGVDPKYQTLTNCLATAPTSANAAACLDSISPDYKTARTAVACLNDKRSTTLECSQQLLSGNAKTVATCLGAAKDSAGRFDCAAVANPELSRIKYIAACVDKGPQNEKLVACIAPYLGADAQKFSGCISGSSANLDKCLSATSPQMKTAHDTLNCVTNANNGLKVFGCVSGQVGGDAAKVANCVNGHDTMDVAVCLYGNKPEVRAAQAAYTCVAKSSDTVSVVAYCAQALPIDDKTRETLTCVARAGGDNSKLVGCAASAALPPDAARMVSCATNSTGATSFALCAAGPAINEEWRIVAECAVETGGNPLGVAGCAAGSLTIRELTKCFTGAVGKDCFGPNNTIVKTLENAFNDLIHGPGPNNEVVKAVKAIGELTGGPNSVINNPKQLAGGPNSMINNPGQIWGGQNSVFNNPSQIWGGPNSVFNNPKQLLGGPNSLINNPGQIAGGPNSAVNQFLQKPLGGNNSFFHCPFGGC
jgi:hypothetical protein